MSASFQFTPSELDEYKKKVLALGITEGVPETEDAIGPFNERLEKLDAEKVLEQILHVEKERTGIDWRAFYENVPEQVPRVEAYLKQLGAPVTAAQLLADQPVGLPNYVISNSEDGNFITAVIRYRNAEIKKYVLMMIQDLQVSHNTFKVGDVLGGATKMFASGLVAVGLKWTMDFAKGIVIGFGARRAAIVAAQGLGAPFCANLVGLLVTYGIKSLLDKQAELIAIVLNRTGSEMNFVDEYAQNGKVISLPRVSAGDDQLTTKAAIERGVKWPGVEMASAGWINARKRDSALKGVKAAFKITFTGEGAQLFHSGAYLGISVPYSGSNKCGCSLNSFPSAETYLEKESGSFSIGQEKKADGGVKMQAYMNSTSGGQVAMIAVCQAPYPEEP